MANNRNKHYSDFLKVKHSALTGKGVYDAMIDKDSTLHVDPMLLKNSNLPEFRNAYQEFIQYFSRFYALYKGVKKRNKNDLFYKSIIDNLTFPELPNTGLGFSKKASGTGISGKISQQLAEATCDIIEAGVKDLEIFALVHFLNEGIGPDRISDMAISILEKNFLAYTERVCSELGIKCPNGWIFEDRKYYVPYHNRKPIIFIPEAFLTRLIIARDVTEIDHASSYSRSLRLKVCQAIQGNWKSIAEMKKVEFSDLVFRDSRAYNALIGYAKQMKTAGYDFRGDIDGEYEDLALLELLDKHKPNYQSFQGSDSEIAYAAALKICEHFKFLVEQCGAWKLMIADGKTKRETAWQHLFHVVMSSYIEGAGLNIDFSPETDNGSGELDFKLSIGAKAKTVIEVKLSDNSSLLHGYVTQLPRYVTTERADHGIFLVVKIDKENKTHMEKIRRIALQRNKPYKIYVVDGKAKQSASKPVRVSI